MRNFLEHLKTSRGSHLEVFRSKVVPRNFTKLTGKHLRQSLFLNKVAGLRPEACNFIKKETLAKVFPCEFCGISESTFFHITLPVAASEYRRKTASKESHNTATNLLLKYLEMP